MKMPLISPDLADGSNSRQPIFPDGVSIRYLYLLDLICPFCCRDAHRFTYIVEVQMYIHEKAFPVPSNSVYYFNTHE